MSAPERFQVGDTVRCVGWCSGYLEEGHDYMVTAVDHIGHVQVDGIQHWWNGNRFVRPTPPALDPFAWNSEVLWTASGPLAGCVNSTIAAWVAWSRFCYWCASVNLAAHFLPTVAAARTRASNGRDVPVAYVDVRLRADTAAVYAAHPGGGVITTDHYNDVRQACRRALGGGA